MKMVRRIAAAGLLALALAACGGGGNTAAGGGGPIAIAPDGENLAFKETAVTAKSGAQVTVNFNNVSTANQHNWVLVKGGDDVAGKVDEEAVAAGTDKGYIPDSTDIVSSIKLLEPGTNGTVTFAAPAAGTYTYICTVPGHYAGGMKGVLTVQ